MQSLWDIGAITTQKSAYEMAVSTDLLCITMSPLAAFSKAGQDTFDRFYSPRETFGSILRFSRGFSDSDIVHSYAKRLRRKSAILLAQIVLSFHNKGPSISTKNNALLVNDHTAEEN